MRIKGRFLECHGALRECDVTAAGVLSEDVLTEQLESKHARVCVEKFFIEYFLRCPESHGEKCEGGIKGAESRWAM